MTLHSRRALSRSQARTRRMERLIPHGRADRYVGTSFRYWLTGLRTGDLTHWERAFADSADAFGVRAARDVCRDFSQWVRLLSERSRRDLIASPLGSPTFGRDECVAMALVAAYQHKACPALRVCAMTLLGCEPMDDVCALSGSLARGLSAVDHVVSDRAMGHVVRYAGAGPAAPPLVC